MLLNGNAQYDEKAKEILDNVAAKYKKLTAYKASFSYNILSPIAEVDETQKGEITVSKERFLLNLGQQMIINDGKTVWTYLKEEAEVNVMNYEPEEGEITPNNIYTMYKKGYKYVVNDITDEEYIIDLSPEDKDNEFFKVRLTISKDDLRIRKWKIFEKNGNRYTYTITSFEENPKLDPQTFSWNKALYPDVVINDLR